MNILFWVVLVIFVLVVILLIANNRFNFFGKYKDLHKDQKTYNDVHKRYKELLDK